MKTPAEWRTYLDTLPEPTIGPSPWEGHRAGAAGGEDAYQLAAELTAKAMLIVADADPTLLDIPDTDTDRDMYDAAWQAAKERWPGLNDWLGGISGNMFGWANQLVRYIHEKPPVGNPAIVTVQVR